MKKCSLLMMCLAVCLVFSACGRVKIEEPEPTAAVHELSEEEKIDKMIADMTLEEKIWQMIVAAPEDITGTDTVTAAESEVRAAIEKYPVGGFILFGKNIKTREQIINMIADMQSMSKIPMFMAVDEEGGRVARLGNADVGVTKFPPMAEIGASGDENRAWEVGATLGRELREIGFNVDFAPVADIITVEGNEDIGDRSFSSDPQTAAKMTAAVIGGMHTENLCGVLKHFPGNGSTVTNTHNGRGICTRTLDEMRNGEFIAFKAGIDAGADMVMVGHMSVPDITGDDTPSSLSSAVIEGLLRNELGFSGLVITDALNMGAITEEYSAAESALMAVEAGADLILMPADTAAAANALVDAVKNNEISQERINSSLKRIFNLKRERGIILE
ncbi:MAG: glycoside hydrolase family 3 protein [Clostridiales bacterium]|nr:glycoside hydrolase family 3 protein [Clostridiales bacterium]